MMLGYLLKDIVLHSMSYFIPYPLLPVYFGVKGLIITLINPIKHLLQLNRNRISLKVQDGKYKKDRQYTKRERDRIGSPEPMYRE